jgi:hypothetical protein
MTSERLVWEGIFEFHVLHLAKVAAADLLESFPFLTLHNNIMSNKDLVRYGFGWCTINI